MNTRAYAPLTLISLVIILVSLTACQSPSALTNKNGITVGQKVTPELTLMLNSFPKDLDIPAILPSTIHDPLLLEGWIRLYDHQEPVQLADGSTVVGRDLAQFLVDRSIPVVWDTNQMCSNGSCSVRYCEKDTCEYEDGLPGVDPIYITLEIQSMGDVQMNFLVGTLAHEIFHRTAPYGKVRDTLYEEFAAYYVGAQIGHAFRLNFEGYDSLNPTSLQSWFNDNGLMKAYAQFKLYPKSMEVK